MTLNGWLQITIIFAIALATARPLGLYMAAVFEGRRTWLHAVIRPVERLFYAASGVDETREQNWLRYAIAALVFALIWQFRAASAGIEIAAVGERGDILGRGGLGGADQQHVIKAGRGVEP